MAAKCTGCGKFVSPSTGVVTCSVCPLLYHKGCVGIAGTSSTHKDWVCPECTKKRPRRGDNNNTPVKNVSELNVPTADSAPAISKSSTAMTLTSPATSITPLQGELKTSSVDEDASILGLRRELTACMAEIREFRKEMTDLRNSLTGINVRLDSFEQRIEAVENRCVPAPDEIAQLERTVLHLKHELNDRDQEALLSDLEIGQLPEEKGENIVHTVIVLGAKLGIQLEDRDIVFAERMGIAQVVAEGGEEPRARRVVVRLARRDLRDRLLSAARVRRTLTAVDAGQASNARNRSRIFINERLTRANRQLFHRVREECRKHQWRYSWTKKGRIYTRQADGKPVHRIQSEEDIARIFG